MHNEELNDLYSSPNIVRVIKWRRMRWAGNVARMGEERGCIGSCWGNRREGDHRWVDIIRMDLQKVGCGYVDWIGLAQDTDRVADACECGNESSGSVKCGEFLDWL